MGQVDLWDSLNFIVFKLTDICFINYSWNEIKFVQVNISSIHFISNFIFIISFSFICVYFVIIFLIRKFIDFSIFSLLEYLHFKL